MEDYYLIQIPEPVLMHLDESNVAALFRQAEEECVSTLEEIRAFGDQKIPNPVPALYLGKLWEDIHYFLTTVAATSDPNSPFSRALLGGQGIGRGSSRERMKYLWADEVREVAKAFSSMTREEIRRRYEHPPDRMSPSHDAFDDAEMSDFFAGEFEILAGYYQVAASRGNAMLLGST